MKIHVSHILGLLLAVGCLGCGTSSPRFRSEPSTGSTVRPSEHQLSGIASYYAEEFNGRPTANGETYDMHAFTAAHRTLPFNTIVLVTNVETGMSVVVRINDRGPFKDDRVIDLSLAAAQRIGLISRGTGPVTLAIVDPTTVPHE
jgi:rare lipoprotein A